MIRRFLNRLLLVTLIAACVYNRLEVLRLEAEVVALQSQQRAYRQTTLKTTQAHMLGASLSLLPVHSHLQAR